jgi:probable F420-dependent oxidoreductase
MPEQYLREGGACMEFGVHLPIDVADSEAPATARQLLDYAQLAEDLGYAFVSANDHIVFRVAFLDGLMCLAAICAGTSRVRLATTTLIPALRQPVVAAKALSTLDCLSGGRLLVGVGAGSYPPDFAACGIPFAERWRRLDECVRVLRQLWANRAAQSDGPIYPLRDVHMEPKPAQRPGPPIWIGSWGAPSGLRRAARLGDGWMASAYNTTPAQFAPKWAQVRALARQEGKDSNTFGNAVVSMFTYITDDEAEADQVVRERARKLDRSTDELLARLLIGQPQECAAKIVAYAEAGVQRIFIWPEADPQRQLRLFAERVMPLLPV